MTALFRTSIGRGRRKVAIPRIRSTTCTTADQCCFWDAFVLQIILSVAFRFEMSHDDYSHTLQNNNRIEAPTENGAVNKIWQNETANRPHFRSFFLALYYLKKKTNKHVGCKSVTPRDGSKYRPRLFQWIAIYALYSNCVVFISKKMYCSNRKLSSQQSRLVCRRTERIMSDYDHVGT